MKPHRSYELQEYNPEWKERFVKTKEKLQPIFRDNLTEIDHIGSTSIEGMVAKPQVDILVVVKNLDKIKELYHDLEKVGFTIKGRGYVNPDDEYIHEDGPDGKRLVSVHIFQEGNPRINDYKIFRDYLKTNKEDRELYISTKRKLFDLYKDNYAEYDGQKRNVVNEIKTRAKEWAVGLMK
jgi:GrpB-like predicted nucleotidyltransferase (UPF0157 family)